MKKIKLFLGIIALTLVVVAPKAVYAKDEPKPETKQTEEVSQRKKMIRELISELNNRKTNSKE